MERDKRPSPGPPLIARLPRPFVPTVPNRKPSKHPVYPLVKPKEKRKRMTIAAGFLCSDGIVLAVDSQYSGGVSKTSGQKLFPIQQNERLAITLATAGHVGTARRAIQKFTAALESRVGANNTSIDEVQDIMEDVLCDVHAKHIYSAPADERATIDFWLLMAVWTPSGYALFRTDVTAVTRVYGTSCIGNGAYLGEYLLDLLCDFSPVMFAEDVKPIASYIIKSAKGFIDGCGLNTFVRVLTDKGVDERVSKEEIKDGEECFDSIFWSMRALLRGALNINALPFELEKIADLLKVDVNVFREKQLKRKNHIARREQERRTARDIRRGATPTAPPDSQSTTTDPSPQQPLQESPEATDES